MTFNCLSYKTKVFFTIIILLLLSTFRITAQSTSYKSGYYFFTEEDVENIRSAAKTVWGKDIISSLKATVEERLTHEMEVPMLEGGHGHHYCCPIHNTTFRFDWDKPTAHFCEQCNKYWTRNNFYNWAWINYVHAENLNFLTSCMYLYIATKEIKYAEYIKEMMLDYAQKYPTYMVHNASRVSSEAHSGKMFAQSLDESVWASDAAKAYLTAKGIMNDEEIKKIEKGYLQECANLLLRRKGGGNWQVWHNSGLVALGVALQNDSIINVAVNDLDYGYKELMKKHVYPDGWWGEGSPIYHFYPLRAMVLTADALRCRNIDLYDQQLQSMFVAPVYAMYADLTFPSHNDGWYGENLLAQAKLYEIAYTRFKNPLFLNALETCYSKMPRKNPEALLNRQQINPQSSIPLESHLFENAGFALLRNQAKTVVLKFGPHGGGHGHPDKLSISIHNGKKEILSDLGTSAYGVPDYTKWYRKTLAHNTITVDGKDQKPSTGRLINFKSTNDGGIVEAEANDAYDGVKMKRKITLKKNVINDSFVCSSDSIHTYDYVLLLNEKPIIKGNGVPVELNDSEAYQRIRNVKNYDSAKSLSFVVGNSKINIKSTSAPFEIFIGEASGIPPTNPGVKTIEGTERRPVLICYPLIVRTIASNSEIKMTWQMNE